MRHLTLTRWAHTDDGVLGRLGQWHTLENPWRDNKPNVSCIPTGVYRCARSYFHKGEYPTFQVLDVPDRGQIKFHVGNWESQTLGCILLGRRVGVLATRPGELGILDSQLAFDAFMRSLEGVDEFDLEVVDG